MDLEFNEEQRMLKSSAREFLEKECPTTLVRRMEQDEQGYPQELWRKMAELGWLGLPFQEQYGGLGADLITLAALLEELGRACDPTPYFSTVVAGGLTLQDAASQQQKQDILPRVVSGELHLTLAIPEEEGSYTPETIRARAERRGDAFVLNGTKLFVENAHIADYILTAVRTADGPDRSKGVTLLLVDGKSPGLSLTPLSTIAQDKQFEVTLHNVEVPADRVLGQVDEAWPLLSRAIKRSAALQCAMAVGGARRVVEMTVEYVKMRVQFGRPIGTFQAVQHQCANMWMDAEAAWLATYEAIWRLQEGLPADESIALAKAWTGEAYTRTCLTAHQLHGGVGFMQEYDLQLWTRRAKAMELKWGTPLFFRQELAKAL